MGINKAPLEMYENPVGGEGVSFEEDEELRRLREAKLRELMRRLREREERAKKAVLNKPVELTDESFERFIREHELVVVDFWAPWCFPCRMIAPVIEELARDYAGRVAFGKLNVDENPLTPVRFGITGIPTLLFFKRGRLVDRIIGAVPRELIEARLRKLMS